MSTEDYLNVEPSVKENSWHYKIYCWVRWHTGYGVYPENIGRCGYLATVSIQAPLLWLLNLTWIQCLLLGLVIAAGVVVFAIAMIEILVLMPIAAALLLFAMGVAKVIQIFEVPLRWFFTSRKWKIVSPWLVTVVLAATLSTFYVDWGHILLILGKTLLGVVLLSAASAIACIVTLGPPLQLRFGTRIHNLLKQKFCPIIVVNVNRYYHGT